MSLIENAAGTLDRQWPREKLIHVPKLSLAVRESAARAMNEPRFQSAGGSKINTQFAIPLVPVSPSAAPRWKTPLVALCSVCIGALLMYAWVGGEKLEGAKTIEAKSAAVGAQPIATNSGTDVSSATAPFAAAVMAPSDTRADAALVVGQWATAWSQRDVERYLGLYAQEFAPPDNLTRDAWQQKRRERILGKQRIVVAIDDLSVEMLEGNRAIARFAQTYEADKYRELRAPKTLILALEDNAWRIAAEINSRDATAQKR